MMNQQPDKFFRDKLGNHQIPAPPAAWDRIESGLTKKNNTAFWLRIAASFLLVAAATFFLWPDRQQQDVVATHDGKTQPKVHKVDKENKAEPATTKTAGKENLVAEKGKPVKPIRKPAVPSREEGKLIPAEKEIPKSNKPDVTIIQQEVQQVEENPTDISPNAVAVIDEKKSDERDNSIKITITAAESEKFLNKKMLAEATPSEKKTSTLQKLLDKAEDLTNNQDTFGDLRQMKNEILALNFKSEKNQRGQNK